MMSNSLSTNNASPSPIESSTPSTPSPSSNNGIFSRRTVEMSSTQIRKGSRRNRSGSSGQDQHQQSSSSGGGNNSNMMMDGGSTSAGGIEITTTTTMNKKGGVKSPTSGTSVSIASSSNDSGGGGGNLLLEPLLISQNDTSGTTTSISSSKSSSLLLQQQTSSHPPHPPSSSPSHHLHPHHRRRLLRRRLEHKFTIILQNIPYYNHIRHSYNQFDLETPSLKCGRLLVIFASAIYGTNFATIKVLDTELPLSISAALRFSLAAAVVALFVIGREESVDTVDYMIPQERTAAFYGGVEVGIYYFIGYICQAEGLATVSAGKSAFFNSLAVIVVPILDAAFKGRLLHPQTALSAALACCGVGLLELGPKGDLVFTSGDVLAFGQTIFFGIGYWRLEVVSQSHSHQSARLTLGLLCAVAGGSTMYALVGMGLFDFPSFEQWMEWLGSPFIIFALMWTGLISTALALYLETVALKVVSASELTLIMTSVSLWGAAFAFVTIGEVLTPTGMVGGLLIFAGCVLGSMAPAGVVKKEKIDDPSSSSSGGVDANTTIPTLPSSSPHNMLTHAVSACSSNGSLAEGEEGMTYRPMSVGDEEDTLNII